MIIDIYVGERKIFEYGRQVAVSLEASFAPIASEDFMGSHHERHVVVGCSTPKRIKVPTGSRPEPGSEWLLLLPDGRSLTAGRVLRLAHLGIQGFGLVVAEPSADLAPAGLDGPTLFPSSSNGGDR
jgi:hypothetical protein